LSLQTRIWSCGGDGRSRVYHRGLHGESLFSVEDWLSEFVTVTFRGPTVALEAIETLPAS
jgi:hypothetical protein